MSVNIKTFSKSRIVQTAPYYKPKIEVDRRAKKNNFKIYKREFNDRTRSFPARPVKNF